MIYDFPTGTHQQCSWCVCSPSLSESACGSELEKVGGWEGKEGWKNFISDGNSLEEQPVGTTNERYAVPCVCR